MNIDAWKILISYTNMLEMWLPRTVQGRYWSNNGIYYWGIYWQHSNPIYPICDREESKFKNITLSVLDTLWVKPKSSVWRFCVNKSNCKAIIDVSMLWPSVPKRRGYSKINQHIKKALYNFILQHPHIVTSSIENYCLKLSIDSQVEPQLVPKLLLQILFRDLHNRMVSPP